MARIDLARVRSFYEAKMAESKEKGESVWVEIDGEKRWVNSERIDLDLYLKWYKETQHRRTEDLGIAAGKGRVLKVWRMLREGVDPNFQFRELWNATALHIAVSKAMEAKWMPLHLFAIEMLLGHGADPHLEGGFSPCCQRITPYQLAQKAIMNPEKEANARKVLEALSGANTENMAQEERFRHQIAIQAPGVDLEEAALKLLEIALNRRNHRFVLNHIPQGTVMISAAKNLLSGERNYLDDWLVVKEVSSLLELPGGKLLVQKAICNMHRDLSWVDEAIILGDLPDEHFLEEKKKTALLMLRSPENLHTIEFRWKTIPEEFLEELKKKARGMEG